jgi:Zinc-finger of the MIZ type in Nse subunit
MSRYATQSGFGNGMSQTVIASNMLTSIAAKEENYKHGILKNHAFCKSLAQRLMKDSMGGFEDVILKANASSTSNNNGGRNGSSSNRNDGTDTGTGMSTHNDDNNDKNATQSSSVSDHSTTASTCHSNDAKIQHFLQEQRNRIRNIARLNIENERTVSTFCQSIQSLKRQMTTTADPEDMTTEAMTRDVPTNDDGIIDYQTLLESMMEEERQKQQQHHLSQSQQRGDGMLPVSIEQEQMYRDICEALGEPVSSSSNDDDDDDEDRIMVMNNIGTSNATGGLTSSASLLSSSSKLKCPITGMYMEEPMKNKVCHHVYSRGGIMQHIRTQQSGGRPTVRCPVPGCNNTNITANQLEKDVETEMRIRQERRRQERNAESLASSANNVDDDDDTE